MSSSTTVSSDSEQPVATLSPAERRAAAWLEQAIERTGGQRREGQRQMALEVARSLDTGKHLLVQAGTGTGKSLAYLVPALSHAVEADLPVVVATATLALQSQIIRRDAPRLLEALKEELPRPMDIALLKGRANYVCLHKLNGGFPADEPEPTLLDGADHAPAAPRTDLGKQLVRLREWAEDTETGDRDDLDPGVDDNAWRQVSVSAVECIGAQRCPFAEECFSERARQQAGEADVVVTNHAMLAIAAFEGLQVLPEFEAVIVDEAHELADRVTNAVTGQISSASVRAAVTAGRRQASVVLEDLGAAADALEAAFISAPSGWMPMGPNEVQTQALESVRAAAREGLSQLKTTGKESTDASSTSDDSSGRHVVRTKLQEVLETAERVLDAGQNGNNRQVAWVSRPGRFEPGVGWIAGDENTSPTVYVAPLSVSGRLRENLLQDTTTILTSATLTVGDSFGPIAGDLGFSGSGGPEWTGIDVGSPFEYAKQGILYVAEKLPKPSRLTSPATYDELEALLRASQGGALCLFSSRRAAEDAAHELRRRLGPNPQILCQGDSTLSALIKQFAEEEDTCLFGTMSLWQGVDVPGRSCRLVVVDRLPFPRPDDPLSEARTRDVAQRGGNGFIQVSATHAAVRLAQGVGRLIRSANDRGVVAILDSRLHHARYGKYIRSALPDFWYTTEQDTVLGALGRLAKV
ncbi:ATP-dependent DNA helicase [Citricoccus sp. NR2]|uniref:ATP-dependent DNA helicase n=1 Tax=Citricoccus sp. NR2 TaxID=3004095 RepID=UPI0022DE3A5E|nr:ATP-dependent DNA helicase [Citricoccus sp. NR2]WBL18694.1 ATP-dependent DNA helicase [Citricoccus sp. NR2]